MVEIEETLAVEPARRARGSEALRPRARILRTLGDELISSETVAVIELVKNAYDADATRVMIRFHEPLDIGEGGLDVIDNGHGMSIETIRSSWMEPATLAKKRRTRSMQRDRRVLGEKGVGRFAASRLAEYLDVVTRASGADEEIRVHFDWHQFDDEQKYLDQVKVLWTESEPTDICPDGTIQALWAEEDEPVPANAMTQGTILQMRTLRTAWGEEQLRALRTGLSRLISPFLQGDQEEQKDEFRILLSLPDRFRHLAGHVEPPQALKRPHYVLECRVDAEGQYKLKLTARGEREQCVTDRFTFPDGHTPRCGPFSVELRVWDRDPTSMNDLARELGSTLVNVRRDLDSAAGINVYRDGFRVLPYGEPGNDWLQLDARRVQNPTMRLSNNQIAGYVLISADDNPQLRDQSNREGLIEGPEFNDLRELIRMILAELETRRYRLRHQEGRPTVQARGLFTDFDLTDVHNLIKQRHPEDTELIALVGEKANDLETRIGKVQEVLARYRRLATLGQLVDTVLHEGRASLSKIGREAYLGRRDINQARSGGDALIQQLMIRFDAIKAQASVLETVFHRIEPFGGRKRGRPAQTRLEAIIADAFAVLDSDIDELGVRVSLPDTDTQVTVEQAEIQEVIVNLLQNSLYWLRRMPKEHRQIIVQVQRHNAARVEILFSDSGPGVDEEFRELIFDPYFSAKPDGIGLGLTIAGEIVNDYYGGDLLLLDEGPLPGATFRITLQRRV